MVRAFEGGIAAVVRGDDEQVPVPQPVQDPRQGFVKLLQSPAVSGRIPAVAPELVVIQQVHEDESPLPLLQGFPGGGDPSA